MDDEEWIGKSVSIECDAKFGVFQGIIKEISETQITITRVFRNGVPLRKQDAEVTLRSADIQNISLIPSYNGQSSLAPTVINKPTPVKKPNFGNTGNGGYISSSLPSGGAAATSELSSQLSNMRINALEMRSTPTSSRAPSTPHQMGSSVNGGSMKCSPPVLSSSSVAQFFGNLIPPKVEVRLGTSFPPPHVTAESFDGNNMMSSSKPIDIVSSRGGYIDHGQHNMAAYSNGNANGKLRNGNSVGGNGIGNGSKKQRKQLRRENSIKQNQTFGTSVDDPQLHEDFDFEGNLALFDKQALWNVIEAEQKPDLLRQTESMRKKKYRHDENILVSEPPQLRQIETLFEGSTDFVTDEGLIIPTIPTFVRSKIELSAEKEGLSIQRQTDVLARGATDLAILLLGGARRLTPNNCHQWPKIVIICEKATNYRSSNIGAATGRQLATHGLKVLLYSEEDATIEQKSTEISLFKATGNTVVYSVNALPTPDLVILSTNSVNLSGDVKKWLSENRASILAIDPPPSGIHDVHIKYAILPILPLNGISSNNCGKLYLCNLGIPDKYYRDSGIKYKSPFGHKFVIPIHSKD